MWVSLVPRLSCVGGTWQAGEKTIYGCVLMSAIVAIRKYTQAKGLGKSYCQCSECLTKFAGWNTLGKHTLRWEGLITTQ